MRLPIILLCCAGLVGCRQKPTSLRPAYLKDEMNREISLPTYRYRALQFEASIHGKSSPVAYRRFGKILIYARSAQVDFQEDQVRLNLALAVEEPRPGQWEESHSEPERRRACEEICAAYIRQLAATLECETSSILAYWSCVEGSVAGQLSGASIVANGSGNPGATSGAKAVPGSAGN